MKNVGFLSLAVLVISSTAYGSCPEEETCAETYSPSVQTDSDNIIPSCTVIMNYIDCLKPCTTASPLIALHWMYEKWCINHRQQHEQQQMVAHQHVKLFLDLLVKYSSTDSSLDASVAVEELASCHPFLECISHNFLDTSNSNLSVQCSGVFAMLDCWGNTTTNCTLSEDLSRRVNESQERVESECLPTVEQVTAEAIEEEVHAVPNISPVVSILNESLSPAERAEFENCPTLSHCQRMLKTDHELTASGTLIGEMCRRAVPEFQCLVGELDSCEIEALTMLKLHRIIGYTFVYCKIVSSASNDIQEKRLDGLLSELKTDTEYPACDELLTCAGDAEISKMQRSDRQAKCSMLQDANECFQENIDACPKGDLYRQIYDENQSDEEQHCMIAGSCGLVQDNKLFMAFEVVLASIVATSACS